MSFYADLGPLDYFGEDGEPSWRAVGWLAAGHPFPQGEVNPQFLERLRTLLRAPWQPCIFMGSHQCDLCPASGRPVRAQANVWIPGDGCIYVAPEMIVHYVDAHGYRPPEAFVAAVVRCPEMDSDEYHHALRAAGSSMDL